jgi:hypothetical protein
MWHARTCTSIYLLLCCLISTKKFIPRKGVTPAIFFACFDIFGLSTHTSISIDVSQFSVFHVFGSSLASKKNSQQALNSLYCLFVGFDLSFAMKLLLTPVGPNDKVIDWIPRIAGFTPHKQHVCVLAIFSYLF